MQIKFSNTNLIQNYNKAHIDMLQNIWLNRNTVTVYMYVCACVYACKYLYRILYDHITLKFLCCLWEAVISDSNKITCWFRGTEVQVEQMWSSNPVPNQCQNLHHINYRICQNVSYWKFPTDGDFADTVF